MSYHHFGQKVRTLMMLKFVFLFVLFLNICVICAQGTKTIRNERCFAPPISLPKMFGCVGMGKTSFGCVFGRAEGKAGRRRWVLEGRGARLPIDSSGVCFLASRG